MCMCICTSMGKHEVLELSALPSVMEARSTMHQKYYLFVVEPQ